LTEKWNDALKKWGQLSKDPIFTHMTAQENLRLVCKIKDGYAKILEKLKLVGLDERKDSRFSTFL
jgi:ABC-2 type transport system ATP-binding protein